jgi:hypothetical protein
VRERDLTRATVAAGMAPSDLRTVAPADQDLAARIDAKLL